MKTRSIHRQRSCPASRQTGDSGGLDGRGGRQTPQPPLRALCFLFLSISRHIRRIRRIAARACAAPAWSAFLTRRTSSLRWPQASSISQSTSIASVSFNIRISRDRSYSDWGPSDRQSGACMRAAEKSCKLRLWRGEAMRCDAMRGRKQQRDGRWRSWRTRGSESGLRMLIVVCRECSYAFFFPLSCLVSLAWHFAAPAAVATCSAVLWSSLSRFSRALFCSSNSNDRIASCCAATCSARVP